MRSAQEEESSLDQTTKGIDREPSRFRAFRPDLERVQRNLRNSRQPGTTGQDLESTKEPHECSKFHVIRQVHLRIWQNWHHPLEGKTIPKSAGSRASLETRIQYNSRWVLYFSGFRVIRAVFFISQIHLLSYHKYVYYTIWCKRIFLIRTNT